MTQSDEWTLEERLIAEQAVLNFRVLNEACNDAPDGKVLAIAEQLAMEQGRELIRCTLESSLRQQAEAVEKKGRRDGAVPAGDRERIADVNVEP